MREPLKVMVSEDMTADELRPLLKSITERLSEEIRDSNHVRSLINGLQVCEDCQSVLDDAFREFAIQE